jgi:hypothetical protein
MKTKDKNRKSIISEEMKSTADHTGTDADADKTGTDANSDCTKKQKSTIKFGKPAREPNPDTTGIDINSDKTKKKNTSK